MEEGKPAPNRTYRGPYGAHQFQHLCEKLSVGGSILIAGHHKSKFFRHRVASIPRGRPNGAVLRVPRESVDRAQREETILTARCAGR